MTRGADEEGTVMLLTIGYALLAMALVLVCVDATSLYLAQKRVDAAADAAALAGADGFVFSLSGGRPRAVLTDEGVREQALSVVAATDSVELVSADTPDGTTARATIAAVWRAPVFSLFAPDGVRLQATATSRTAFG